MDAVNYPLIALGAEGGVQRMTGDITNSDILKTNVSRNLVCPFETLYWRCGDVCESIIRKKPREMKWHVITQFILDPKTHSACVIRIIIQTGNQEIDNLKPFPRLSYDLQGPQTGL